MKSNLLFLFVILTSFAYAQENSCANKEKQLVQYLSDNENTKALELWKDVNTTCPKHSENLYALGNRILQYEIEIADKKDKVTKVNDLLQFFNQYDKYFPANKNGNFEKRAIAQFTYNVGTPQEVFANLDKAFEKEKATFANSQAIYNYFDLYFAHYKENKAVIPQIELLDKYCAVSSLLAEKSILYPSKKRRIPPR